MHPRLRSALVMLAAALLAAWTGLGIADGSFLWPGLIAVLAMAAILSRVLRLPFDVILLGFALFGYLVGNRGFAQLMPIPGLPLLPAEIALGCAVTVRAVMCAFERRLPVERNPLHLLLIAWLVLGSARFVLDFPRYGMLAARDFALVYYAGFFFVVQHMARDPRARAWLSGCLQAGLLLLPVSLFLSLQLPGVFMNQLTLYGAPLVFFKGDLAFIFIGVAALVACHSLGDKARRAGWILAAALLAFVLGGNNRSSLAGLLVVCAILAAARRWRFPACLAAVAAAGIVGLAGLSFLANNRWAEGKLAGIKDRVVSLVDFHGTGSYESEESSYKGDNNRFRKVWWTRVIEETWQGNPALGLGFGHDLAAGFLQEYYADSPAEEFTARSPHNVFLTVFGRMGLAGLAVWLSFCVVLLTRTWRALHHDEAEADWALWCGLWVILVSAAFGVVLEGPMGAVPFWVMLGLAAREPVPKPAAEPKDEGQETNEPSPVGATA